VPTQVREAFSETPVRVSIVTTGAAGIRVIENDPPDVVLLDLRLPDADGFDIYGRIRELDARIPVIFVTMAKTANTAIEAMKRGAFNYLFKPLDVHQLRISVNDAFEVAHRMRSAVVLAEGDATQGEGDAFAGACPAMLETYKAIGRVAAQDVTVLITGESGTGKELVARAIYQHGARAKAPFLALNCAAIPENLLESELFGHEKGAFTGADRRRIGKFEQCQGGTLLLDEIGDMPPSLQSKLLRVLQEKTFERVGGSETLHADVRILASTHRDLKNRPATDPFRPDLYYRLSVFTIHLPPLRERSTDIDLLARHYVRKFSRELHRDVTTIAPDALAVLRSHSWPGNIRELQSVLMQALLKATGLELLPAFLPDLTAMSLSSQTPSSRPPPSPGSPDALGFDALVDRHLAERTGDLYADAHRLLDRHLFTRVLAHTRGNQRDAAQLLGIARQTMRSKLRALGMQIGTSNEDTEEDE
jgi:two-component system nitrogen regulation response regulator GlnG